MENRAQTRRFEILNITILSAWLCPQLACTSSAVSAHTNHVLTLQTAVDALPSEGGTIDLPCGTYGAVTISTSNVKLVGSGSCTVITAPASGSNGIVTVTNGAANTSISNLQIQGQAVDQTTIQRCVYLTGGSTRTTIQQVIFAGTITSNGCNIQVHSDSTSSGNVIENNMLTQAIGTSSGGGYGVLVENSSDNTITDNVSIQSATQGRHHVYISAGSSYNIVTNNQLSGGTSDQIVIYALDNQPAAQHNVIQGNLLTGMGSGLGAEAAIHVCQNATLNRVIGNQVLHPAVAGIEVEASAIKGESHADDNDVQSNLVYFAGQFGILILGSSDTTVRGNAVYESSQANADEYSGIEVSSDGEYATAQNNQIVSNTSYGYKMQRNGLQIDFGAPQPSKTVVNNNNLGVGVSGSAFFDGGLDTVIGRNALDYRNPDPPQP